MEEELLYTQEDIDEWMRTCEGLEESLREKRTEIKDLQQDNKQFKEQLAIREKALKNSCIKITELDFILNGIIHNYEYWRNKFIKQAKDSMKGE